MSIPFQHKLVFALGLSSALSLSSVLGLSSPAWAQSGTKAPAGPSKAVVQGSGTAKIEAPVALSGYWPVCVVENKGWVKGDSRFAVVQDGKTYLFPSEEVKQMFSKNPTKYANVDLVAQGQCTVCRVEMRKEVQGKLEFTAFHKDMRYWFPSEDQLKMFVSNPAKYEVK
jgi:YHS domain-containing protein